MPVEPPRSAWLFPDLADPLEHHDLPDDLVGRGADLRPGTLLAAYRAGIFPMAEVDQPAGHPDTLSWWSPQRRGVLRVRDLRVTRSLARSARAMEVRVDTVFAAVVEACADPTREGGWISPEVVAAYTELHHLGWAHSVETWRDGELVGGLYGVADRWAVRGRVDVPPRPGRVEGGPGRPGRPAGDEHADRRLLDVQWQTPHLASLGVTRLSRPAYFRAPAPGADPAAAGALALSPAPDRPDRAAPRAAT